MGPRALPRYEFALWEGGRSGEERFGRAVAIQHGKHMSSLYAHFEDLKVAVGQLVHRGTVLGVVENSGRATGLHLHFEVRVGGIPVDPSWVF